MASSALHSPTLCIFANFRIDTAERLQRMQDSFLSFAGCNPSQWVLNIRGGFNGDAASFLKERIPSSNLTLTLDESSRGWDFVSRKMAEHINADYVFFWIEDHIMMAPAASMQDVLRDMRASNCEYLEYSWWTPEVKEVGLRGVPTVDHRTISTFVLDGDTNARRQQNYRRWIGRGVYIISCVAIFDRQLFMKVLSRRYPLFRRWSKHTPFNFEKRWDDVCWLPVRAGILATELFACIDDDNLYPETCLIARGIYPERLARDVLLVYRSPIYVRKIKTLLARFPLIERTTRFLYQKCRQVGYQF